jgi:hypothetical protein
LCLLLAHDSEIGVIVFMMCKGWIGYGMRVWQDLFEGVVTKSTTFWVSGVGDVV